MIVSAPARCTTSLSFAFGYTCASVAGLVPSFVGAEVLFGNSGSVVNVFLPDILCAVFIVTYAHSTPSNSSWFVLVAINLNWFTVLGLSVVSNRFGFVIPLPSDIV